MQIAAGLKQKGAVYASDVRAYKLDEVKKRAKRAQFDNVRTLEWNGEKLPKFPREIAIRAGFDTVLVDAPCSSSGTWRRNPDAKIKVTAEGLQSVSQLQLAILNQVCTAVKKGGTLVYSTCTWLRCENEDVVAKFLLAHPEFSLVSQECFGSPWHDSDTMFAAVLKK